MDIFFHLFQNLVPLYALIALGWIAGRYFEVDRQSIGSLGIYILMPVVAFGYVAKLEMQPTYFVLPIVIFVICSALALIYYRLAQSIYSDSRANLLALCAASGNTGYFGLPIVFLLFEPEWVGVYIFAMVGLLFYEATVMYYIVNRGKFDVRQSLIKLLKFPTIYACIAAIGVNASGVQLPELFDTYWGYFQGAYVVIGMMIIGAALAKTNKLVIAPRFITLTFAGKFIIWPLVALATIALDKTITQWFTSEIHQMIFLMAIVPPAANIAAFAAQLDMNPEKAASTILLGTVFALFYIPAILVLSGMQ